MNNGEATGQPARDVAHDGIALSESVAREIEAAAGRWTRSGIPAIELRGQESASAVLHVTNQYAIRFGQALGGGMGRGGEGVQLTDKRALAEHAKRDVERMRENLADTARRITGEVSAQLHPELPAEAIAGSGAAAVCDILCAACGGSTRLVCPSCAGTLRINCTSCQNGQARCASCSGTGQTTRPCHACGGTGGSYSAAATWDFQYQKDTWDYQKRQTASGGQWQACSSCGGSKGAQVACGSCSYGRVTCSACAGRGYRDCHGCNRTGQVACGKCSGGYTHARYSPQVVVKHSRSMAPDKAATDSTQAPAHAGRPGRCALRLRIRL